MHDKNGKPIKVGDRVKIEYEITETYPGTEYCNVTLKPLVRDDGKMGSANTTCNSRYTELISSSAASTPQEIQEAAERGFKGG